jgi:hypothetical protein
MSSCCHFDNYIPVTSSEIKHYSSKYHRKKIIFEGLYISGINVSVLNGDIWLKFRCTTIIINQPSEKYEKYWVKVYGHFDHIDGKKYGHLRMYDSAMIADRIIYYKRVD